MIRNGSRTRKRLLLCTLFAIAALLATAGVAAGAQAVSADGTAAASTAVAQDDGDTVELDVTKEYDHASGEPDAVFVDYVVENPEIQDRADVDRVRLDLSAISNDPASDYDVREGLTEVDEHTYEITADADRAVVQLRNEFDQADEHGGGALTTAVPMHLRECSDQVTCDPVVESTGTADVEPAFTFEVPDDGFVTSGNSEAVSRLDETNVHESPYHPLIVMGEFERVSSEAVDGRKVVVVVPDDLELREDANETADVVAEAAARLDGGSLEGTRYAIAVQDLDGDVKGLTFPTGARWFQVKHNQPIHTVVNTWIHEYVHTTDPTAGSFSQELGVRWFHEGYAVFRAQQLSLATGHGSFDEYRAYNQYPHDTERQNIYIRNYFWAPLGLSVADFEMRKASNGENTTADLVRSLEENYHDEAGYSEIYEEVSVLANESVGNMLENVTWARNPPEPLTLEQYQETYGPVPNLDTEVTEVRVSSHAENTTVETDGPLAVHEGATVEFDLTVRNTGDADGHYKVEARDRDPEPNSDPSPTVYDEAHGTVDANGATTVTLTYVADEQGTIPLEVARIVPDGFTGEDRNVIANPHNVTVLPQDAAIVRDNGGDGEHGLDEVVTNETSTIVYQASDYDGYLSESLRSGFPTNEHGVREFDPESWAAPGEDDCLAFALYGEWRCVASLPPVNGTIPADVDDDGDYMDMNADGQLTDADADIYFQHHLDSVLTDYLPAYDFDDDGDINLADAVALSNEANS